MPLRQILTMQVVMILILLCYFLSIVGDLATSSPSQTVGWMQGYCYVGKELILCTVHAKSRPCPFLDRTSGTLLLSTQE